jgi:xylan 1,4-beta-xylosidase
MTLTDNHRNTAHSSQDRVRGYFWHAVVLCAVLGIQASCRAQEINLSADARQEGKPLAHFWSKVVGAGRANEALRATWQEELEMAHRDAGFQYVRFHGLFHDDMFVYREDPGGQPVYNYQYIDDVFDRMLAKGVKPFVELGFVPEELATVKNTTFWWHANGSPPTDNARWAELVKHTVQHFIDRYGRDEVRTWYFEVWNEPNLGSFYHNGTQAQYFELYKLTAETVKAIDSQLKVGGPATSNFNLDGAAIAAARATGKPFDPMTIPWKPVWVDAFLTYCSSNHLPVDFLSTHPYPQDFAIDEPGSSERQHLRRSIDSTRDDLRTLREIVNHSPYPKAEIQLTEWNSSPSPVDHSHDALAAAAFVVKTNIESIGLVDSLSYWTFTDVFEENRKTDSVFHGGFGLINYQEIPKAAFHGYRMMNALGDRTIAQTTGGIVTNDTRTHRIAALIYNYPPEVKVSLPVSRTLAEADAIDATGSRRDLVLHIDHLPPSASFLVETLDRTHGNAISAWEEMGKPEPPTREQTQALLKAARGTQKEIIKANSNGVLEIKRPVAPWSVVLVTEQARGNK